MKIANILMSIALLATLVSCGGDEKLPSLPPEGIITGNAVDALIIGGTVRAYSFENGVKGEEISTSPVVTDKDGFFSIDVKTNHDQPIVLEVVGGSYIEEASGLTVSLTENQFLRAVYNYKHGSDILMMVTTWTHLASADAAYKISQGIDAATSVNEANKDISDWLGVDIVTTYPVNITDSNFNSNGFYSGVKYGLAGAALSQWTLDIAEKAGLSTHGVFSSIAVNNIMYNDIASDGKLDGVVDGAHVVIGGVELTADAYRQNIAASALRVIQRENINNVGISLADSIPFVKTMASTDIPLFSDDSPLAIDTTLPEIEVGSLPLSNGQSTLDFIVDDFIGVNKVELFIDGVLIDEFTEEKGAMSFDSSLYPDGDLELEIKATDYMGNVNRKMYTTRVANNDIAVGFSSTDLINYNDYTLIGEVLNAVSEYDLSVVNGTTIVDGSAFFVDITLPEGVNEIHGNVIDSLGRATDFTKVIYVDQTAPNVIVNSNDSVALWVNGVVSSGDFPVNNNKSLYISYDTVRLGLINNTKADLERNNITFLEIIPQDFGEVTTKTAELKVSYSVFINDNPIENDRGIVRNINGEWLLPITTEFMQGLLSYNVEDEIKVIINVADNVKNSTLKEFVFSAFVDLPVLSQNTMFKSADIAFNHYSSPFKGAEILTCKTDALMYCEGRFTHSTDAMNVSLSNGFYVDTLDKEWEVTEEFQTLVDFYELDKNIYLTPLARGYVGFYDFNYKTEPDTKKSIDYARTSITSYYSFDPLATAVGDLCHDCELTPEIKHALYLGGMSVLAEKLDTSPLVLAKVFSDDVSADGFLNGKGLNGLVLSIGDYVVSADTFRRDLALAINEYHFILGKPLGNTKVGIWAQEISLKTSDVFDPNDTPTPMDDDTPTAGDLAQAGEWISGLVTFEVTADDLTGIARIAFLFSGDLIAEKFNSFVASFSVDTTTYTDGEHQVRVDFSDDIDNRSFNTSKVYVDNTAPILTDPLIKDKWVNKNVDFKLDVDEISPYKHVLSVSGVPIGESENDTVNFDTTAYPDGELTLLTSVTDSTDHVTTLEVKTNIDNTLPILNASGQNNTWQKGTFDYLLTITDISPTIATVKESGVAIGTIENTSDTKLRINTTAFTDGMKTLTTEAIDSANQKIEIIESIGFDNNRPVIYESGLDNFWFSGSANFSAIIEDISPYTNTVTIDGVKLGDYGVDAITIDTTAYNDGTYTINYNVVDSVNLQTDKDFVFKLDNLFPSISDSPLNNSWQKGTFNFYAPIAETNTYSNQVAIDDINYKSVANNNEVSISTSAFSDGPRKISYAVTDASGKLTQKDFTVNFDNTDPIIYNSSVDTIWHQGDIVFTAQIDEISPYTNTVTINGVKLGDYGVYAIPVNTLNYSDGAYTLSFDVVDSVGHQVDKDFVFNIDNFAPVIEDSVYSGTWQSGTLAFYAPIIEANTYTNVVEIDGILFKTINDNDLTISTTSFSDGPHVIEYDVTDESGRNTAKMFTVNFDNNAPVLGALSHQGTWLKDTISHSIASIAEIGTYTAKVSVNGSVVANRTNTTPFSINTKSYPDGNISVIWEVTDHLGFVSNKSGTFKIDNTKPVINNFSGANQWHLGNVPFVASVSDANSVTSTLTVNGTPYSGYTSNVSRTLTLSNGTHNAIINSVDAAGNAASRSFSFSVDKTNPSLSVSRTTYNVSEVSSVVVSGTVSDTTSGLASVKVNGSAASVSGSNWSKTITGLSEGNNNFTVVALDKAGRSTSKSFSVNRTVTPANKMEVRVTCESVSKTSKFSTSLSCSTSTSGTSDTINLSSNIPECAGSGTCSVVWSGSGVSALGSSATITKSLSPMQTLSGTALGKFTDSANAQVINMTVNWSMTRAGECTPSSTQTRSTNLSCPAHLTKTFDGEESRTCNSSGYWGGWSPSQALECEFVN